MTKAELKNIKNLIEYWKIGSEYDLSSAEDIAVKAKRFSQALFSLHLACEKALKAAVVYRTQEHAPYSHNLIFLARKAEINLTKRQEKFLTEINEFNLECRYPDHAFKIYKRTNEAIVKRYLKFAKEFTDWIFEKLRQ